MERNRDETLKVTSRRNDVPVGEEYDFVVVALPNDCPGSIEFGGDDNSGT